MSYIHRFASPAGALTLASDGRALTGLWFDGQRHFGSTLSGDAEEAELEIFAQTERWLSAYFSGREPDFLPPLRFIGSAFSVTVWELLLGIPYGRTLSYGELARRAAERTGRAACARAVGSAVGRNPISIVVPCHRVIRAGGSPGGYAAGTEIKKRLLALEHSGGA